MPNTTHAEIVDHGADADGVWTYDMLGLTRRELLLIGCELRTAPAEMRSVNDLISDALYPDDVRVTFPSKEPTP